MNKWGGATLCCAARSAVLRLPHHKPLAVARLCAATTSAGACEMRVSLLTKGGEGACLHVKLCCEQRSCTLCRAQGRNSGREEPIFIVWGHALLRTYLGRVGGRAGTTRRRGRAVPACCSAAQSPSGGSRGFAELRGELNQRPAGGKR